MDSPRIIEAERHDCGLLLAFDDDVCAFYSADLLRSFLQAAELLDEAKLNEE